MERTGPVAGVPGILVALAMVSAFPALAAERSSADLPARLDCRYFRADETPTAAPGPQESVVLPDNDVFRPILADQREPRFYADYRRVHFRFSNSQLLAEGRGPDISAAMVAFGGAFGLWGRRQRRGCDGLQISLFGVVFSQFNMSSHSFDLLNSDYLVGPVMTFRSGAWSARFRFYHQSSHLGDEFLLNYGIANGVQRQNLSVEVADLLVSLEDGWWRLFAGGGGILFSSNQPDLTSTPGFVLWGLELRGRPWGFSGSTLRPVFGAAMSQLQATSWSLSGSVEGGLEWASPRAAQRVRALVVAQRGALPFSQFFSEKTQNLGVQLQFEY
jgi:Protein of unknown function (DUF1207)